MILDLYKSNILELKCNIVDFRLSELNILIKKLVSKEIKAGNLKSLCQATGLSKHWFYEVKKGGIKDPGISAVYKFLKAIDNPIYHTINQQKNN